jgi:hypothetical protein
MTNDTWNKAITSFLFLGLTPGPGPRSRKIEAWVPTFPEGRRHHSSFDGRPRLEDL